MKRYFLATAFFCAGAVSGCEEKNTTAFDLDFLEVNPRTVEVLIPFGDFVDDLQVFGGYGSAADLGRGFVGQDFGGLDARTLVHVGDYPTQSAVVPGTLSFSTARVVLFFDTLRGTLDGPVEIALFDVQEPWHPPTVTWTRTSSSAASESLAASSSRPAAISLEISPTVFSL